MNWRVSGVRCPAVFEATRSLGDPTIVRRCVSVEIVAIRRV